MYRANITVSLGGSGAPAIMAAGTEEQKREFIPKLISGEYMFAQGFTEPRGGADLARCNAGRSATATTTSSTGRRSTPPTPSPRRTSI